MDQRPIAVFDSGLGGLTALRELRKLLPGEELIYFGDTGRVPYGGRSRETIRRYTRQDTAFLCSFHPKAIVVACGTVSANALDVVEAESGLPVFGVVEPAARAAVEASRGKVGVIGTAASIRSGAYERAISGLDGRTELLAAPCPLFVPMVENGRSRPGDQVVELVAREYLEPFLNWGADTLVLGCTHYPLLREVITGIMGEDVALVDPGAVCAEEVARTLAEGGLLSEGRQGSRRYFVSDAPEDFARLAAPFLSGAVDGPVDRVEIESW